MVTCRLLPALRRSLHCRGLAATAPPIIAAVDRDGVRIDKWLWAARLFKTRTLAAEAVDGGHVRIDGQRIKPAREARVGDRLEVAAGEVRREYVILALSSQRGPAAVAQQLYEETVASRARRERRRELQRFGAEPAQSIKGRPTKRDGRALRDVRRNAADDS
jgi:ribosome-associated heat shock protein Hsp15